MRVRPLIHSDIPILQKFAESSGFPYPPDLMHPHIEAVDVVVDINDRPIAAFVAKRLIEGYGYFDPEASAVVKMSALRMAHESMAKSLRAKMYTSIDVFIPPQIADTFGRRLERTFGWVKNQWSNWTIRF